MSRINVTVDVIDLRGLFDQGIFDSAIFKQQGVNIYLAPITAQATRPAVTGQHTAIVGALFDTGPFDRGPFATRLRRIPRSSITAHTRHSTITVKVPYHG